jgi:hypothetical protein
MLNQQSLAQIPPQSNTIQVYPQLHFDLPIDPPDFDLSYQPPEDQHTSRSLDQGKGLMTDFVLENNHGQQTIQSQNTGTPAPCINHVPSDETANSTQYLRDIPRHLKIFSQSMHSRYHLKQNTY